MTKNIWRIILLTILLFILLYGEVDGQQRTCIPQCTARPQFRRIDVIRLCQRNCPRSCRSALCSCSCAVQRQQTQGRFVQNSDVSITITTNEERQPGTSQLSNSRRPQPIASRGANLLRPSQSGQSRTASTGRLIGVAPTNRVLNGAQSRLVIPSYPQISSPQQVRVQQTGTDTNINPNTAPTSFRSSGGGVSPIFRGIRTFPSQNSFITRPGESSVDQQASLPASDIIPSQLSQREPKINSNFQPKPNDRLRSSGSEVVAGISDQRPLSPTQQAEPRIAPPPAVQPPTNQRVLPGQTENRGTQETVRVPARSNGQMLPNTVLQTRSPEMNQVASVSNSEIRAPPVNGISQYPSDIPVVPPNVESKPLTIRPQITISQTRMHSPMASAVIQNADSLQKASVSDGTGNRIAPPNDVYNGREMPPPNTQGISPVQKIQYTRSTRNQTPIPPTAAKPSSRVVMALHPKRMPYTSEQIKSLPGSENVGGINFIADIIIENESARLQRKRISNNKLEIVVNPPRRPQPEIPIKPARNRGSTAAKTTLPIRYPKLTSNVQRKLETPLPTSNCSPESINYKCFPRTGFKLHVAEWCLTQCRADNCVATKYICECSCSLFTEVSTKPAPPVTSPPTSAPPTTTSKQQNTGRSGGIGNVLNANSLVQILQSTFNNFRKQLLLNTPTTTTTTTTVKPSPTTVTTTQQSTTGRINGNLLMLQQLLAKFNMPVTRSATTTTMSSTETSTTLLPTTAMDSSRLEILMNALRNFQGQISGSESTTTSQATTTLTSTTTPTTTTITTSQATTTLTSTTAPTTTLTTPVKQPKQQTPTSEGNMLLLQQLLNNINRLHNLMNKQSKTTRSADIYPTVTPNALPAAVSSAVSSFRDILESLVNRRVFADKTLFSNMTTTFLKESIFATNSLLENNLTSDSDMAGNTLLQLNQISKALTCLSDFSGTSCSTHNQTHVITSTPSDQNQSENIHITSVKPDLVSTQLATERIATTSNKVWDFFWKNTRQPLPTLQETVSVTQPSTTKAVERTTWPSSYKGTKPYSTETIWPPSTTGTTKFIDPITITWPPSTRSTSRFVDPITWRPSVIRPPTMESTNTGNERNNWTQPSASFHETGYQDSMLFSSTHSAHDARQRHLDSSVTPQPNSTVMQPTTSVDNILHTTATVHSPVIQTTKGGPSTTSQPPVAVNNEQPDSKLSVYVDVQKLLNSTLRILSNLGLGSSSVSDSSTQRTENVTRLPTEPSPSVSRQSTTMVTDPSINSKQVLIESLLTSYQAGSASVTVQPSVLDSLFDGTLRVESKLPTLIKLGDVLTKHGVPLRFNKQYGKPNDSVTLNSETIQQILQLLMPGTSAPTLPDPVTVQEPKPQTSPSVVRTTTAYIKPVTIPVTSTPIQGNPGSFNELLNMMVRGNIMANALAETPEVQPLSYHTGSEVGEGSLLESMASGIQSILLQPFAIPAPTTASPAGWDEWKRPSRLGGGRRRG